MTKTFKTMKILKQQSKWLATAIAVAGGMAIVVTGHFKTSQPGSNQNRPL